MPNRIQRRRTKGWRMPEGAVYVGRPTQWGNPYRVGPQGTGEQFDAARCIEMYRFTTQPSSEDPGWASTYEGDLIDLRPLRGKDLACWCPLDQPCHADVLLEIANS